MKRRSQFLPPAALYLFLFIVAIPAGAQTPAAAPAAMPKVPAHTCVKPEFPGKLASNTQINAFNRDFKVYDECIKAYVDSTKALTEAAVDAGNKAIAEYNSFANEIKAQAEARK